MVEVNLNSKVMGQNKQNKELKDAKIELQCQVIILCEFDLVHVTQVISSIK